jgi:hypothetical protein
MRVEGDGAKRIGEGLRVPWGHNRGQRLGVGIRSIRSFRFGLFGVWEFWVLEK